jgi:hypothetical protein
MPEENEHPTNESEAVALHRTCSAPIAQAMLRYWDIAAELKDLKAEQKLVGEQWEDLFHTLAETNVNDWLDWAFGGGNQEKIRRAWEVKNPRFRLTRRGVESRPNDKDQMAASPQPTTRGK